MRKTFLFAVLLFISSLTTHAGWKSIGNAQVVANSDQLVVVTCGDAQVQITPLSDDIIRVRVLRETDRKENFSWAVSKNEWVLPKHEFKDDSNSITLSTKNVTMKIQKNPFRISFLTPQGEMINQDDVSKGMGWDGNQVRVWKQMPSDELYFGFGEKTGKLQKRGSFFVNWNNDIPAYNAGTDPLYHSIPFFIGMNKGRSYGIFFDNTFRSSFDMGKESENYYSFGADGGTMDYYFFNGPTPKAVVQQYTELTGKMNLPPKWAIGYQQCRWSYFPDSKVREIANTFRNKRIPCDVLYLDIDYMEGYRVFTWSKKNFPFPSVLIKDLKKEGFKVVTIIDPGIKSDDSYMTYNGGLRGNHFVRSADSSIFIGKVWPGECAFPDFINSWTRRWWGEQFDDLVGLGVKGFWNDMNEPSVFGGPRGSMPLTNKHNLDGRTIEHAEAHNVYGMQMARATYEGAKTLRVNERPFVLTRAGYAGIQRYAAAWTGDNVASWEHLALTIPMCLNFGLSGQSFVGSDIGGFIGSPSGELYTRWLQYGVFLPLSRTHTAWDTKPQEPWSYGNEYEKINKKFIELRYQLLPFLYTEFYKASTTGIPIMRPLMLEFPNDKETYNNDTQFMVGENILVSPILEQGATSRSLYLPEGEWYDFWTKEKIAGGKSITVQAPIDNMPIHIKAGAIIPMQQIVQYTDEEPIDPMTFEIYSSSQAKGICYEDDGASFSYQQGEFRSVEVHSSEDQHEITIERAKAEGTYIPSPRSVLFVVNNVAKKPVSVLEGGRVLAENRMLTKSTIGWNYDAAVKRLSVKVSDAAGAMEIVVKK